MTEKTWEQILREVDIHKTEFNRVYKCLNKKKAPTGDTRKFHLQTLISEFNAIKGIFNSYHDKLTKEHRHEVYTHHSKIRDRLNKLLLRLNVNAFVPTDLDQEVDLNIPNNDTDTDSESETENMPLTAVEFLNLATKILPEFDGKPENLQRFIDAINLINTQVEGNQNIAIELVKTKLVGTARNLITNENTVTAIVNTLKSKVKGDTTEVLIAKIMNTKQYNKPANQYTKEVEDLTKALTNAYISDGVSAELAEKYSTQTAVKAMASNAANDKVKLIMQSGQFGNMNDAVAKFVNSCTEINTNQNVMYVNSYKRKNYSRTNYHYDSRNPKYYYNRTNNNNRGRQTNQNKSHYNKPNYRNSRNIRIATTTRENSQSPQRVPLGDA